MEQENKIKDRDSEKPKSEPIRVVEVADEYFLPGDIVEIDEKYFKRFIRDGVRHYILI